MLKICVICFLCLPSLIWTTEVNFEESASGLLISFDSSDRFAIRRDMFGFREGIVVCRELSGETLEYYDYMDDSTGLSNYRMDCDDDDNRACDCEFDGPETNNREIVNVSCLAFANSSIGSLRQLADGRIVELVRDSGRTNSLVWAHYCYTRNQNWNARAANLACQSLGFDGVSSEPGSEMIRIPFTNSRSVFGLEGISCGSGATSFSDCTRNQRGGSSRCRGGPGNDESVIAIRCANIVQTSTTVLPTEMLTSSMDFSVSPASSTIMPSSALASVNTQSQQFISPSATQQVVIPSQSQQATQSVSLQVPENTNIIGIVESTRIIGIVESTRIIGIVESTRIILPTQTIQPTPSGSTTTVIPTANLTQDNNVTKIIAIVLSLIAFLIILVIIVIVIIVIITVYSRRRKNKTRNMSMPDDPDDGIHYESTRQLSVSDNTYNIPGDLITINQPAHNHLFGRFSSREMINNNDIYYETPTFQPPDEDIYDSLIYQSDVVVPSFEDRRYYNITTGDSNENLYLQTNTELPCFVYHNDPVYWEPEENEKDIFTQMCQKRFREINSQNLTKNRILGQGNFGFVHSGIWKSKKGEVPVAIKSLKMEDDKSNVSFLQEALILGQFNHPNILKLLGVVTITKPLMMVTELMQSGLKEHLDVIKKAGQTEIHPLGTLLARFTIDIALGMQYLAGKNFIHRDLAARNILVNRMLLCKIGDFGLARETKDDDYYLSSGGLIPLRWTAPEAIFYKKYSEKSDVWSYGVTLHEIWSVGRLPWEALSTEEVIDKISENSILSPPTGCPRFFYDLMVDCWHPQKESRPSFEDVVDKIRMNDSIMLQRGSQTAEQLKLGLDPMLSQKLFLDLQNKYK